MRPYGQHTYAENGNDCPAQPRLREVNTEAGDSEGNAEQHPRDEQTLDDGYEVHSLTLAACVFGILACSAAATAVHLRLRLVVL